MIAENKRVVELLIPYAEQGKVNQLYQVAQVMETEYLDEGVLVIARVDAKVLGQYAKYMR